MGMIPAILFLWFSVLTQPLFDDIFCIALGNSVTVARLALDQLVGVQIPVPQLMKAFRFKREAFFTSSIHWVRIVSMTSPRRNFDASGKWLKSTSKYLSHSPFGGHTASIRTDTFCPVNC
jgi:hypothetical protein